MSGGFLTQWFQGLEQLLVRAPRILTNLGEPNYEDAVANKFSWDVREDEDGDDDVNDERPFFVLSEDSIGFRFAGTDTLEPYGAIEVYYTQPATYINDHKLSKADFCDVWSGLLLYAASEQGRPIDDVPGTVHISLAGIQVTLFPQRPLERRRHAEESGSDYWEASALFFFGQGP